MTEIQMKNKELIEKYPFLKPRNVWNGEELEDYDYSYTIWDDMPEGWKKCFGEELCEDLKEELERCDYLDKWRIVQLKEKYGTMRLYDDGSPRESRIQEIIDKYEHISKRTCICCGKFPVPVTDAGWVSPICKDCFDEKINVNGPYEKYVVDDSEYDPVVRFKRFTQDEGELLIEYDTSDIVNRIIGEMPQKEKKMEYSKILRSVLAAADRLYASNEDTYESYDNVKSAVAKYCDNWYDITFGILIDKDIDCKKIIWQIILDLRFSRNTESLYGSASDSMSDAHYLNEITSVIEKATDEFNTPGFDFILTSGIDAEEYTKSVKELGLK